MTNTTTPETFAAMATLEELVVGEGSRGPASGRRWPPISRASASAAATCSRAAGLHSPEVTASMALTRPPMWANSKDGRWFADCALGCNDLAMARRYGPRP